MAKLVACLLATAALWVGIQTTLKDTIKSNTYVAFVDILFSEYRVTVRSLLLFRIGPLTVVEKDIINEHFCESVLWIRIGSASFCRSGSGSGSVYRTCRSGSVSMSCVKHIKNLMN